MRRRADIARGLLAAVILLALVAGVPALLVTRVGWPLPTRVPRLEEFREALVRSGVSDRTVVKCVAVVLWLAWLQLAWGVLAESWSVVRRKPPPRGPLLPSARRSARALVGALVVLYTSTGAGRAASAARSSAPLVMPRPAVVAAAAPAPSDAAGRPTWVVRRRDTLWGIAEQVLGRGERWREIQRLNADRQVAPGVFFSGHEELIRPGWVLALPSDALVAEPAPDPGTYRVARGDTLRSIAASQYRDAAKWRLIWDANRGRLIGGRRFDDPNLILVGWDLVLPVGTGASGTDPPAAAPEAGEAVAEPPGAVAPADPPGRADAASDVAAVRADPGSDVAAVRADPGTDIAAVRADPGSDIAPARPDAGPDIAPDAPPARTLSPAPPAVSTTAAARPGGTPLPPPAPARAGPPASSPPAWVLPSGITGAALLATGAAGLLASRRRRRLARLGPGETLPVPDPDLAATDAALQLGADAEGIARLDLALRALTAGLAAGEPGRPVAVLRTAGGDLIVHFTGGRPAPPPPWNPAGDGALVLPADVPLTVLAAGAAGFCTPCPALVFLGCSADAEVYLDLEAIGVLVVEGPTVVAQALARGVVATLAVSPIADDIAIVAVGVDCYGFANERRVTSTAQFADAARLVREATAPIRRQIEAGIDSTFTLRRRHPLEPWEPVVLVALRDRSTPAEALVGLCGEGGRGVGVVTDVSVPSAVRLAADVEGRWHLEPYGWTITPAGLAAQELADLGAILADALAAPVRVGDAGEHVDAGGVAPAPEPPWVVLVRLLGPVDVVDRDGRAATFTRSKSLELVVWLAEHRAAPLRNAARAALWASDVRDATFANVVSEARRALAALAEPPGGDEWIARTGGDRLLVAPALRTDAELLAAALARARRLDGTAAIDVLRDGLALVRDAPYSGTDYLWPDGEGRTSNLVVLVTTAATEMATRCLETGDSEGAFWATSQGLRVLPAHDELVCLRMEAHAAGGNVAGVRLEFEAYERALAADRWGDAEPAPKVVATRARLTRPGSPH